MTKDLNDGDISFTVDGQNIPLHFDHVKPEATAKLCAPNGFFCQQGVLTARGGRQYATPKSLEEYISVLRDYHHHDFAEGIETAIALHVCNCMFNEIFCSY